MDVQTALEECGGWGPFQRRMVLTKGILWLFGGFYIMVHIFAARAPEQVCIKKSDGNFSAAASSSDEAPSADDGLRKLYQVGNSESSSSSFSALDTAAASDPASSSDYFSGSSQKKREDSSRWLSMFDDMFDRQDYLQRELEEGEVCDFDRFPTAEECKHPELMTVSGGSLVVTFELQCHEVKVAMIQSFFFAGFLIGAATISRLTDIYGRVFTMWWCTILAQIGVLLSIFAGGYWTYTIGRIALGFSHGGAGVANFVYQSEFMGKVHRTKLIVTSNGWFSLGVLLTSVFAFFVRDFRWLIALPSIGGALLLIPLYNPPESPIWLTSQGRTAEARDVLCQIAERNACQPPPEIIEAAIDKEQSDEQQVADSSIPARDDLRSPPQRAHLKAVLIGWWQS